MASLKLGHYDQQYTKSDIIKHMKPLHRDMSAGIQARQEFRDDGDWFKPTPTNSDAVEQLQLFLQKAGFMPHQEANGIFDYYTLASVRLFQEYVRSVEGIEIIGKPDGWPGSKTFTQIERWKEDGLYADWGLEQAGEMSFEQQMQRKKQKAEYDLWFGLLKQAQQKYLTSNHPVVKALNQTNIKSDTLRIEDWLFDTGEIHLIGIRRSEDHSTNRRLNDDIFILLVNGMVFKFWGSTDPSANMIRRQDEAFLVEGQHRFRFGWHKVKIEEKIYKAMKPANKGVLVFRDQDNDNALTDFDISPDKVSTNHSINIHWSGIGGANFSAGCQVIAGKNYINHLDEVVDCSGFASTSYNGLKQNKTKGAYNVLSDLILAYSPKGIHTLLYTLGRDESLEVEESLGAVFAEKTLARLV